MSGLPGIANEWNHAFSISVGHKQEGRVKKFMTTW
jgi:hypothetical protein